MNYINSPLFLIFPPISCIDDVLNESDDDCFYQMKREEVLAKVESVV